MMKTSSNVKTATQSVTFRSAQSAERAFHRVNAQLDRFLRRLHRLAVADSCPGDLFVGWDRPTLRSCRPDDFARLVELEKQLATARAWCRWFAFVPALPLEFAAA